jgi:hypothetical protein
LADCRSASILASRSDKVSRRPHAIARRLFQNSSSRLTLVLRPARTIECLKMEDFIGLVSPVWSRYGDIIYDTKKSSNAVSEHGLSIFKKLVTNPTMFAASGNDTQSSECCAVIRAPLTLLASPVCRVSLASAHGLHRQGPTLLFTECKAPKKLASSVNTLRPRYRRAHPMTAGATRLIAAGL